MRLQPRQLYGSQAIQILSPPAAVTYTTAQLPSCTETTIRHRIRNSVSAESAHVHLAASIKPIQLQRELQQRQCQNSWFQRDTEYCDLYERQHQVAAGKVQQKQIMDTSNTKGNFLTIVNWSITWQTKSNTGNAMWLLAQQAD
mmetsp:Transcript_2066/g.5128  ORF Transcript_2066/g.5128 Transcript_2066/m.5128 type:complete len:143 (-) Transcript_2066:1264-1692(-)